MTQNISSVTAMYDANLRRHKGKNKQNKYQRSTALSSNFKTVTEDTFISFMVDSALNVGRNYRLIYSNGAMSWYLLSFWKRLKRVFASIEIEKIKVQTGGDFCYLIFSCRLLLQLTRMGRDWNLKVLGQILQVFNLMLCLQNSAKMVFALWWKLNCLRSSS